MISAGRHGTFLPELLDAEHPRASIIPRHTLALLDAEHPRANIIPRHTLALSIYRPDQAITLIVGGLPYLS